MLAAEFPLAVAPAAGRDRGSAAVDAADIDRDGAPKLTDHADAVALDIRILGEEGQGFRGLTCSRHQVAAGLRCRRNPACRAQTIAEFLKHLAGLEQLDELDCRRKPC
jgi:hypothetical protein